ncbi:MAG: hypothetical protein GF317_16145 [Candidatus Lokiarchaeota archaeon]|nr:hypothetical protein [Candidatus Lokiarchaeota archaeon]MBD3201066.1 hypothetical protein [Candidatus Lokiarchaeota archaeon]
MTPQVNLTRIPGINEEELSIELDMVFFRHDGNMQADAYFVDLAMDEIGGGLYYSATNWSNFDSWKEIDWGPCAWKLTFSITDNEGNSDILQAPHKIWQQGSWRSMDSVLYGGPSSNPNNAALSMYGPWINIFEDSPYTTKYRSISYD